MRKTLFYNSVSATALYLVNVVVTFIMSPIFIRALGNRDYGLWELLIGIIGYMGILDLGIGPALLRYVAVEHGRDNRDELHKVVSSAQVFFLAVGAAALLILLVLSLFPHLLVPREKIDVAYLTPVIAMFAINTALKFPLTVYTAVIMGLQLHYICNMTRIVLAVVRAFAAYFLLASFHGKGLLLLVVLELMFNLLQMLIYYIAVRINGSIPALSLSACRKQKLLELLNYGAKSAVLMVANRLQNSTIPFVITHTLGVGSIVFYAMPNRLIEYGKGFSLAMSFPLTPYFASQLGSSDKAAVRSNWLEVSFALQIITLAMPLVILFTGEQFLSMWIGKDYGTQGRGVLYSLVAALFVEALVPNASRILLASGHHGRAAATWLVLAVISIPMAVVGANTWGVAGVALGSSIAIIVGSIVTLHLACHDVEVTIGEYCRKTFLRLIVPLVVLAAILWLMQRLFPPASYYNLGVTVGVSGICYLVAVWVLALDATTKWNIMTGIMRRFAATSNA